MSASRTPEDAGRDFDPDVLGPRLAAGAERLGIGLDPLQQRLLLDYLALLLRWNRTWNLTAIRDPAVAIERHLLESLALVPWLRSARLVDAGTGAGLPGVPLAIACSDRHFLLIDSSGKKIRFLRQVRRALQLPNIEPLHCRLEACRLQPPPDEIVVRALAPLPRLITLCAHWLNTGARMLAMKARLSGEELGQVPDAYNVRVEALSLPGPAVSRCLVIVERASGEHR